jgi:hypothetical protein
VENESNMIVKKVKYTCNECGTGEVKYTGNFNVREYKPYEHKCENCECLSYFTIQYPFFKYVEAQ